jgi:hypothetical protein
MRPAGSQTLTLQVLWAKVKTWLVPSKEPRRVGLSRGGAWCGSMFFVLFWFGFFPFFFYSYVHTMLGSFLPALLPPTLPPPSPPTPSLPGRNYFALISNFVVERV